MQLPSTFQTLFQSPPPIVIKAVQGFPGLQAKIPGSLSHRSTTSEQQKVIREVNDAFSTKSTQSEPGVKMLLAREKVQTMLNTLASEDVFDNIDLKSLLRELVITKKDE